MRTLIINLLATALLLFGAASASAYSFSASLNPGSADTAGILAPSDFVIIDVYADVDISGTNGFTVAVLFDDDPILVYEPGASTMASYILYTGGKGATYLVPNVEPPGYWNGIQQPGKKQVNVEFIEVGLGTAPATGNNLWLATLVFHIADVGDGESTIELTLAANGTIVQVNDADISGGVTTDGTFTITTAAVPEPTTALLIGFGLVGLTLAGRRQD